MSTDAETRQRILKEFHDRLGAWAQRLGDPGVWAAEEGGPLVQGMGDLDIDQVAAALHDEGHPAQAKLLRDKWTNLIARRAYPLMRWACGNDSFTVQLDEVCGPCGEPSEEFRKAPTRSSEVLTLCGELLRLQGSMKRLLNTTIPKHGTPENKSDTKDRKRSIRKPSKLQNQIAAFYENTEMTQAAVAELLTAELHRPISQDKVSRAVAAVNRWRRHNPELGLPQIATRKRKVVTSVDPDRIALGARTDGAARRYREQARQQAKQE